MKNLLTVLVLVGTFHYCVPKTIKIAPSASIQNQYGLALEAIFGMGIRLQALLDSNNTANPKNFVVCPISATIVLSQLLMGAEGEFREELYELLSLPKSDHHNFNLTLYGKDKNETYTLPYSNLHLQLSSLIKKLEDGSDMGKLYVLNQKSGVFVNNKFTLKPRFINNLQMFYDAQIYYVNFAPQNGVLNQNFINQWVSNYTNGLIKEVLPSPPAPSTASLFLNAVYFLAEWETPFSDMLNRNDTFYISSDQTVQAQYMLNHVEQILYAEAKEYRLICLPYKNSELGMYILLPNLDNPNRFNIRKFAEELTAKEVLGTLDSAEKHDVLLKLPKLSITNTVSILEPLRKFKKLNQRVKFESDAFDTLVNTLQEYKNLSSNVGGDLSLSGAAENANVQISDIVQKMVFSINEKGTEAAAITAGIIDYIGGSKSFLIDRPFAFFIRHEETSATLFWGTISDPSVH